MHPETPLRLQASALGSAPAAPAAAALPVAVSSAAAAAEQPARLLAAAGYCALRLAQSQQLGFQACAQAPAAQVVLLLRRSCCGRACGVLLAAAWQQVLRCPVQAVQLVLWLQAACGGAACALPAAWLPVSCLQPWRKPARVRLQGVCWGLPSAVLAERCVHAVPARAPGASGIAVRLACQWSKQRLLRPARQGQCRTRAGSLMRLR